MNVVARTNASFVRLILRDTQVSPHARSAFKSLYAM